MPFIARPVADSMVGPTDSTVPPFGPGAIIANKYRVDEVLGCGGMAWVLRATHLQLNQKVALKFLRFAATRETVARFFREGQAAARVSSESVTRVLDVDTLPDGSPFLVMEYLDGRDLEKVVADPGVLPVTKAVDFAIQACEGLSEVHAAGIVHRDLKPANLFLARKRNGSMRLKLLDFGISKFLASGPFAKNKGPATLTQSMMGSPIYMAPEQMRSSKHVDGRADIWSLGVILYELLSGGRSPFEGETLPEICMRVTRENPTPLDAIRPELPQGLVAVVDRCLAKDPAQRFSSAASLAIALAPYGSYDGQILARRLQRRPSSTPPPGMNSEPGGEAGVDLDEAITRVMPPRDAGGTLAMGPTSRLPSASMAAVASIPAFASANPPTLAPTATPTPTPAAALPLAPRLRVDARIVWAAFASSAFFVVVSAASFAAGVHVSAAGRSPGATTATVASPSGMGVTNAMPRSEPAAPVVALPSLPVETIAPPPGPHVYTPEELPLAPREPKGRHKGR
ncbi:MAG TPA: serine/threonine-protein kinase [Polyangiaceae bacterium]|nr:serine/threonine-protein kinase [Polyangiaceae bacterium]